MSRHAPSPLQPHDPSAPTSHLWTGSFWPRPVKGRAQTVPCSVCGLTALILIQAQERICSTDAPLTDLPNLPPFVFSVCLFRAAPPAYGGSQVRNRVRATPAGLHHGHSHTRSELHLQPTPPLMATPDP